MTWRYIGLTWILAILSLGHIHAGTFDTPETTTSPELPASDPESILATGGKLPLTCSDHFALELISGVSTTLTSELLKNRLKLRALATRVGERAAFLSVKGVGDKKRDILLRYISLLGSCRPKEAYDFFIPTPHPRHPVR
jgi:hypothetical protein